MTPPQHEHEWGPVGRSRLAGTPRRECVVPGCRVVTLDLTDEGEDG